MTVKKLFKYPFNISLSLFLIEIPDTLPSSLNPIYILPPSLFRKAQISLINKL